MNTILTAKSEKSLRRLEGRVKRLRSLNRLMVYVEGLLLLLVFVLGALAAGIIVQIAYAPPRWVSVLFFLAELVALFLLVKFCVLGVFGKRGGDDEDFALQIENRLSSLQDRLASAIGLGRVLRSIPENAPIGSVPSDPRTFSLAMLNALFIDAKNAVSKLFLAKALIRYRALVLLGIVAGTALLSTQTTRWTPYTFNDMMNMYLDPLLKSPFTRRARFVVEPGNIEIYPGESFTVKVTLFEEPRREPVVAFRTEKASWEEASMNPSASGVGGKEYTYDFNKVMRPMEYYVTYEGDDSSKHRVTVVRRPRLSTIKVVCVLPDYLGNETSIGETGEGDVYAPWRSRVHVRVLYDMELKSAILDFFAADVDQETSDEQASEEPIGESIPQEVLMGQPDSSSTLTPENEEWTTSFILDQPGYYRITATEKQFGKVSEPVVYKVAIQPNLPPTVVMQEPSGDVSGLDISQLPIIYDVRDDFGVNKIDLVYAVKGEGKAVRIPLGEYPNDREIRGQYDWDISKLKRAGKPVSFALEAFDRIPLKDQRPNDWDRESTGLSEIRNILWEKIEEDVSDEIEDDPGELTQRTIAEDAEVIIRTLEQGEQALEEVIQEANRIENSNLSEEQKKQELEKLAAKQETIEKVVRKAKQQAEKLQKKIAQAKPTGGDGESGEQSQPSENVEGATASRGALGKDVRGATAELASATGSLRSATSSVASATGQQRQGSRNDQNRQPQQGQPGQSGRRGGSASAQIASATNQQLQKTLQSVAKELGDKVENISEDQISVKPGVGQKMKEAAEEMEKGNTEKAKSQNNQIKQQLRNMQQRVAEAAGLEKELESIRKEAEKEALRKQQMAKSEAQKGRAGARSEGEKGDQPGAGGTEQSGPNDYEVHEDSSRYNIGDYKMEFEGARSVVESGNFDEGRSGLRAAEQEKVPPEYEVVVRKYFELLSDDS